MKISLVSKTKDSDPLILDYKNPSYLVLAQRVLTDSEYAKFYKQRSDEGAHIILNNGAGELGESLPDDDLIWAANIIRPSQIVLPDKIDDMDFTIERGLNFLSRSINKLNHTPSFIAVIQGKNDEEWNTCFKILSDAWGLETLAITNNVDPSKLKGRIEIVLNFLKNPYLNKESKRLFLLGTEKGLIDEIEKEIYDNNFIEGFSISVEKLNKRR